MAIKFVAKDYNLEMIRGDTLSFAIKLSGLDQDLSSAKFSCKNSLKDSEYVFQKSLSDGITKVEQGIYRVRVAPEDTENLAIKSYIYDLEIGVNGDKFTIMRGSLTLIEDVTRED